MATQGNFTKAKRTKHVRRSSSSERTKPKLEEGDQQQSPRVRRRRRASSSPKEEYTKEELAEVSRIRNLSGRHYAVLGVEKSFTSSELKKTYNSLALKVHPDKNRAPGAKEAFQALGEAYLTLSDEAKRKEYDASGGDNPTSDRRHPTFAWSPPSGSPSRAATEEFFEELLRELHRQQANAYFEQNSHREAPRNGGQRGKPWTLREILLAVSLVAGVISFACLPLILEFCADLPELVFGAPCGLEKTSDNDVHLQTPSGVGFYADREWYEKTVRSNYAKLRRAYREIERLAEEKRVEKRAAAQRKKDAAGAERQKLHDGCELERTTKERKMAMAKTVEELEEAQHMGTPSCRKLRKQRTTELEVENGH